MTSAAAVYAAALWGGPGTTIGGAAAAWWWGLTDSEPREVELIIPPRRNLRGCRGVRVVRRQLPAEDCAAHRRVRVVGLAFAAVFGAVALGPDGQRMLDRALLRRLTLEEAVAALDRNPKAWGAGQARAWLRSAADGTAAESERRFAALMRDAGITGWQVNRVRRARGHRYLPDFLLEPARLVVELDGWAFHSDPERFEADRTKQNAFTTTGWRVLRYTWSQLTGEPDRVVAEVRAMLALPAHRNS